MSMLSKNGGNSNEIYDVYGKVDGHSDCAQTTKGFSTTVFIERLE